MVVPNNHYARFVYRLGPMVFIHKRGVRFPYRVLHGEEKERGNQKWFPFFYFKWEFITDNSVKICIFVSQSKNINI